MALKGHNGTSLGGIETSPKARKRQQRKRRAEEKRWQSMNGPVEVRRVEPKSG